MHEFTTPQTRGWNKKEIEKKVDELRSSMVEVKENTLNAGAFVYEFYFHFENSIVFLRLLVGDWQEPTSDLLITNLVNTPSEERRKGNGTKVIETILEWATRHRFNEVRVTQVTDARRFWEKNGFVRIPEPNPYDDHVRRINSPNTSD